MKFCLFCLLTGLILNSPPALANGVSVQEGRFLPDIEKIAGIMSSSDDPQEVMQTLLRRGRIPAFNVQGMARFYRKKYDFFKALHRDFKTVEDFVGKIDQWENELRKAESEDDSKRAEKAKDKLEDLYADMTEELFRKSPSDKNESFEADKHPWMARAGEISKAQYYIDHVGEELAARSYDEDRELLIDFQLKNVKDMVDDYKADKFDNLELDNGIHPFRKDLRWILIEMRVSNGFFTFDPNPNNCDIEEFRDLPFESIAQSKYSKLGQNNAELNPCYIQQCVFLGVADLQNKAADIKDEIEDRDVVSEKDRYKDKNVPKSYQNRMEELYSQFLRANPWEVLEDQLKACK